MAGKGSRQRTFGKAYEDGYDRIFGQSKQDTIAKGATRPSVAADGKAEYMDQYPIEAREMAKKGLWEA